MTRRARCLPAVQSFGQAKCPVIHVRGTHNMFSCYNVGENVRCCSCCVAFVTAHSWGGGACVRPLTFAPRDDAQVLAFNSVMTARQLAEFSVSDADEEMGRLIRDIEVLVAEQQRLASR